MDSAERQFARLTRLVLDGIATEEERVELSNLSQAHPQLVLAVADELLIDALLNWQSGNIAEHVPQLNDVVVSDQSVTNPSQQSSRNIRTWVVAASMLLVVGLSAWKYSALQTVDAVLADIIEQREVAWNKECTALGPNNTVSLGYLSSSSGEYTLQFRDGSCVRIDGPASLEIKSKMLVRLDQGQATANVPKGSEGFTITSALVDVIDQGTQFGISVGKGRADVVVFDGKVELQSRVGDKGNLTPLNQGDSVQIDQLGAISRLADVRRDDKGRWWTDKRDSVKQVIARVSDNIHSGDGGKTFACYQTTVEGLQEDVLAYSDNPHHQWNGLTARGLPAFLRGADYIKTFNDYRYIEDFQMKIELAQPANLYIFLDDRVEAPEWLKANFEDTGVDIGLDEGPWMLRAEELLLNEVERENLRKADVNKTAKGGGNSIDNLFSVWRRRCVDGGTVSLGHAGDLGYDRLGISGKPGRAMYGIAATPLDRVDASAESSDSVDGT